MGASSTTTDDTSLVIKAAKKELKRSDSNSLKIKQLTKSLLTKFESNDSISKDSIKSILVSDKHNDVFVVDGKIITLKKKSSKKRKSMDNSEDTNTNTPTDIVIDKKAAKKAAKKAKKDKKKSSSSSTTTFTSTATTSSTNTDNTSIQQWRTKNKIVLKDANKNDKVTKSLDSNTTYYPYQTFDIDSINKALLEQCTDVNGFKVPSPIQAQCWVSFSVFFSSQNDIILCSDYHTHSNITNTHHMLSLTHTNTFTLSQFY